MSDNAKKYHSSDCPPKKTPHVRESRTISKRNNLIRSFRILNEDMRGEKKKGTQ